MFTEEEIRMMVSEIEDKKRAIERIREMGFSTIEFADDVKILSSILEKMKVSKV